MTDARLAQMGAGRPMLQVVVDTEEEFDWTKPFDRRNVSVASIEAQHIAQSLFAPYGLKPTYCVDYPVATTPAAVAALVRFHAKGECAIGAHLHPWVNPPFEEEVSTINSYAGNLPPQLELQKLVRLTDAIEQAFGQRPVFYKAGRYGIGPSTFDTLRQLGYIADLSVLPHTNLQEDGGPDFRGHPDRPYWLDNARTLLEIPITRGFSGIAASYGARLRRMLEAPLGRRLRSAGMAAKLGLLEKATLTPEAVSFDENRRLISALVRQGHRVFTLSYHSPSLMVGNTPYVQSKQDLAQFLDTLKRTLAFFFEEIGGRPTTAAEIYAAAVAGTGHGSRIASMEGGLEASHAAS